jgi:hypothetical protein
MLTSVAAVETIGPDTKVCSGRALRRVAHVPVLQWTKIQQLLGSPGRPMVGTGGKEVGPFGTTSFYSYEGVIFEARSNVQGTRSRTVRPQVTSCGYCASVTIFQP